MRNHSRRLRVSHQSSSRQLLSDSSLIYSFFLLVAVRVASSTADRLVALVAEGVGDGLLLTVGRLLRVGRGEEVARVVDDAALGQAPLEHLRAKVVPVAQVGESDDEVARLGVLHDGYCRDDADLQPLCRLEGKKHNTHTSTT